MKISRAWAMPNKNTFSIKPIENFVARWVNEISTSHPMALFVDPFCGENRWADITNDLNPNIQAMYHEDALEFLKNTTPDDRAHFFFDPPYSPRQISESYKNVGIKTNMQTTQSSWYSNIKDELARLTPIGNYVISASWNTNGVGKSRGFELIEILMVPHGGWHNDTLVIVERKVS
jgi:hypothetical protein